MQNMDPGKSKSLVQPEKNELEETKIHTRATRSVEQPSFQIDGPESNVDDHNDGFIAIEVTSMDDQGKSMDIRSPSLIYRHFEGNLHRKLFVAYAI